MATKTEICNSALLLIGASMISDFQTESNKAGQLCRMFYDGTVNELLEQYPWTFAMKRVVLDEPLQDSPLFGFSNAFRLPVDYLDIVETDLLDSEWRVEQSTIIANTNEVSVLYVARVEDTGKYTPLFTQTLQYLLAAKLAIPLTRSRENATLYYQLVEKTLGRGENANSHPNNQRFESDALISVRR